MINKALVLQAWEVQCDALNACSSEAGPGHVSVTPELGKQRQVESQGSMVSGLSPLGKFQASERPCFKPREWCLS